MNKDLNPALKFSSLYGDGLIFVSRPSPNASRWLPQGDIASDMLTAGLLTVIGNMTTLCASSVSTPYCLGLLKEVGFNLPNEIIRFSNREEYLSLIKKFCSESQKLVTQHVHTEEEITPECCWINPRVLSFVNNKANLSKLTPADKTPTREIVSLRDISKLDSNWRLPAVIKAVTDQSTGAGADVRICFNSKQLEQAISFFKDCSCIIVEEFMQIVRNLCLNFRITKEGCIKYLGFAEQVSDENGIYQGNWIDISAECPREAIDICTEIAQAGFGKGYFGIVGIDIAVLANEEIKVFDLNFRANGSTPAVLYAQSIYERYQKPVMRFRRLISIHGFIKMIKTVEWAIKEGLFLPLACFDPQAGNYQKEQPRILGLILGNTRQDVFNIERILAKKGLN